MKTLRMVCALAFVAGCGGGSTTDAGTDGSADTGTHDAGGDAGTDAGGDAGTDLGGGPDLGPDLGACDSDGDRWVSDSPACGGDDCNDSDPSVHPALVDVCNGIDDDCDGLVDEGVSQTYYPDSDGDGWGDDTAASMAACSPPAGYSSMGGDCNDANAAMHPGALEICNGIDDDCDGIDDPASGCMCTSGTARSCGLPGACAAGVQMCIGGTYGPCSISPTPETCNGVDDDCNGVIDDGLTIDCYVDGDNDGYAPGGASVMVDCPDATRPSVGFCPFGTTNRLPRGTTVDCDDGHASVNPAGAEVCDGLDNDCDGSIDDGLICP